MSKYVKLVEQNIGVEQNISIEQNISVEQSVGVFVAVNDRSLGNMKMRALVVTLRGMVSRGVMHTCMASDEGMERIFPLWSFWQ